MAISGPFTPIEKESVIRTLRGATNYMSASEISRASGVRNALSVALFLKGYCNKPDSDVEKIEYNDESMKIYRVYRHKKAQGDFDLGKHLTEKAELYAISKVKKVKEVMQSPEYQQRVSEIGMTTELSKKLSTVNGMAVALGLALEDLMGDRGNHYPETLEMVERAIEEAKKLYSGRNKNLPKPSWK